MPSRTKLPVEELYALILRIKFECYLLRVRELHWNFQST